MGDVEPGSYIKRLLAKEGDDDPIEVDSPRSAKRSPSACFSPTCADESVAGDDGLAGELGRRLERDAYGGDDARSGDDREVAGDDGVAELEGFLDDKASGEPGRRIPPNARGGATQGGDREASGELGRRRPPDARAGDGCRGDAQGGDREAGGRGRWLPVQGNRLVYAKQGLRDADVKKLSFDEESYGFSEIDFSQNNISQSLPSVLRLCQLCPKLAILKLFKNRIGDDAAPVLAEIITLCSSVRELHLSHNCLTSDGIALIVDAADQRTTSCTNPLWLRVENNQVSDQRALLRDMEERFGVCPRRARCSQFTCVIGSRVHMPFLDMQREKAEREGDLCLAPSGEARGFHRRSRSREPPPPSRAQSRPPPPSRARSRSHSRRNGMSRFVIERAVREVEERKRRDPPRQSPHDERDRRDLPAPELSRGRTRDSRRDPPRPELSRGRTRDSRCLSRSRSHGDRTRRQRSRGREDRKVRRVRKVRRSRSRSHGERSRGHHKGGGAVQGRRASSRAARAEPRRAPKKKQVVKSESPSYSYYTDDEAPPVKLPPAKGIQQRLDEQLEKRLAPSVAPSGVWELVRPAPSSTSKPTPSMAPGISAPPGVWAPPGEVSEASLQQRLSSLLGPLMV